MTGVVKPAVKAVIRKDGRLLVLKTKADGNTYHVLPGGKVEYGEAPGEALKRELAEELSVEAEILDAVGMYHFFTGAENQGDQIILTVFEVEIIEEDIDIESNPADENITDWFWLTPEELIRKSGNESLQELVQEKYVE